jgi:cation diffusion facilitator family transporter
VTRFAWLSIAAAIATIALKVGAWWLTGSVGLLSDALESVVNLVAAVVALIALTIAAKPADEQHAHGHGKAEYFSSGTEGVLIIVAAIGIMITAIDRLLHPRALERLGLGLAVSVVAGVINLVVALVLLRAGRRARSITLEADGQHLLTDVFTTIGVLAGVGMVAITGKQWLDPIIAIGVGLWIVRNGVLIVGRTVQGLLDHAVSAEERAKIEAILEEYRGAGIGWHALRTRIAGARVFVTVHVLVPGEWSVQKGHDLCERIEARIRGLFPIVTVMTHLEPVEDEVSYRDQELDRQTRE